MQWTLMNGGMEEAERFTEKELVEMAKNRDGRINRRTLVRSFDSGIKNWQTVAQTEELEFGREHLYKDPEKLIWPKPPDERKRFGTLLSFLLLGLGQMYLGQVVKGLSVLVGTVILGAATMGTLVFPIWVAGIVDTYKLQKKLGSGQPIHEWEFF